jgi:hypothetical protein
MICITNFERMLEKVIVSYSVSKAFVWELLEGHAILVQITRH